MAKQTPRQKAIVGRVMHEFRQGELETLGGEPVEDRKRAIAIALHEAGSSDQESPAVNRRNLRRTTTRETRQDLYEEAKQQDVPGRSKMNKAELKRALS